MAYLLDSDVFIRAKRDHYGFDFCPAFWDWLEQARVPAGPTEGEFPRSRVSSDDEGNTSVWFVAVWQFQCHTSRHVLD